MSRDVSVSDGVADRVKTARRRAGYNTVRALAARCAETGSPHLTENVLHTIESGRRHADGTRRRHITVDELVALAAALGVSPVDLLFDGGHPGDGHAAARRSGWPWDGIDAAVQRTIDEALAKQTTHDALTRDMHRRLDRLDLAYGIDSRDSEVNSSPAGKP